MIPPKHVAFIMDGNGRWAKRNALARIQGHKEGAKTVRLVVEECRRLGVKYVTLFAFSSENWSRPTAEVDALMKLFEHHLDVELKELLANGIRLRAIGDRTRLSKRVLELLERTEEATRDHAGMQLILAVSYGGRDEIVNACQKIAAEVQAKQLRIEDINKDCFQGHLYAPDVPDPDLLIRTSSEFRISNFLLWQLAYAEIVVTPLMWPEFSKEELLRCFEEYSSRERRFGLTGEQMAEIKMK